MSAATVRKTLLDALFRRPRTIASRDYLSAREELFPGEQDFREFLQSDDSQELAFLARRILLRLSFSRRLMAPTRLLLNLADFENQVQDKVRSGDYVPRDHFVHLVNLYLLGIYFFAYHRPIHNHCIAALAGQKRQWLKDSHKSATRESGRGTGYHLFAAVWSYFVLMHDLAYPIEKTPVVARAGTGRMFKPFQRASRSAVNDLALRAVARMVVFRALTRELGPSLWKMFLEHETEVFPSMESGAAKYLPLALSEVLTAPVDGRGALAGARAVLSDPNAGRYAPRVIGPGGLRLVGSLLPDCNVWAVLEGNGGEGLVVVRRSERRRAVWLVNPREEKVTFAHDPALLWKCAFVDAVAPRQNQEWRYFLTDEEQPLRKVASLAGKRLADFDEFVDKVESRDPWAAASVEEGDQMENLAFAAFETLGSAIGFLDEEVPFDRLRRAFASREAGFGTVSKELPLLGARYIERTLREGLEAAKTKFAPAKVLLENTPAVASEKIANVLWRTIQQAGAASFKGAVADGVADRLHKLAEFEGRVRTWQDAMTSEMLNELGEPGVEVESRNPFSRIDFDEKLTCENLAPSASATAELSALFAARDLPDFPTLLRTYRPAWAEESAKKLAGRVIDHGLAAASLVLVLAANYRRVVEALKRLGQDTPAPRAWVFRAAMRSVSKIDEIWAELECGALESEVAFAIATHNLYPEQLDVRHRNHRARLTREPFAFLALLADGLQQWDRRALVDTARSEDVLATPGSRFNLRVVGNSIMVSLTASRLDMQAEQVRLRSVLDRYLDGASRFVKLGLAETTAM